MQVWTKTSGDGKRIEYKIDGRSCTLAIDGQGGASARIFEILERDRKPGALFAKAPRTNPAGDRLTHAILGTKVILLTAEEGQRVTRIVDDEARIADEHGQKELREEYAAQIAEAARTGEPVCIKSWMDDCDDPHADCSTDLCEWSAMPDGTFQVLRIHTH